MKPRRLALDLASLPDRTLSLALPLTDRQIKAIVVAADRLGVEPWEIAVHALALRQRMALALALRQRMALP